MSDELNGKSIAMLAADGVEKVELEQPRAALLQEGARVEVLSLTVRCGPRRSPNSTVWCYRAER